MTNDSLRVGSVLSLTEKTQKLFAAHKFSFYYDFFEMKTAKVFFSAVVVTVKKVFTALSNSDAL